MRLVSITPKPESQCVEPTLVFDVVLGFVVGQRVPLDLAVVICAEDKRLVGVARPSTLGQDKLNLDAQEPGSGETSLATQLVLPLSAKQVDHLEGLRSKHRKGDVVLEYALEAQFLASRVVNAPLQPGPEVQAGQRGGTGQAVVYSQRNGRDPFYSQVTNMWVLSGDGSRTFMERQTLRASNTITISSGDWLHDYSAPWRTTRYMVVELPQPEMLTSTPNIDQRVNEAIEAAKNSANNIAKGEWNDALEDLRPVWELLRKQADIAGLLQRDGYTPDAIAAFEAIVHQQFALASKFLHRLDQSGKRINPEIRAWKEDALVCYSCAMSLLNLVSRKAVRLR